MKKKSQIVNSIIENLKSKLSITTDVELSKLLNVKPNTISTWKNRGSIDYEKIISVCEQLNLSLDEIILDRQNTFAINHSQREDSKSALREETKEIIPLLPTYAVAGESLFSEVISHNNIEDYLRIPNVRADFAVPVSGESMHPYYRAGDIIACKIIKDASFFQWGRVYLLNTRQGLMLKRIYPGSNGNVRCVSYNSDYPPFELPQEDILSVAVVVALVRIE